jgi:hypothetical protein
MDNSSSRNSEVILVETVSQVSNSIVPVHGRLLHTTSGIIEILKRMPEEITAPRMETTDRVLATEDTNVVIQIQAKNQAKKLTPIESSSQEAKIKGEEDTTTAKKMSVISTKVEVVTGAAIATDVTIEDILSEDMSQVAERFLIHL